MRQGKFSAWPRWCCIEVLGLLIKKKRFHDTGRAWVPEICKVWLISIEFIARANIYDPKSVRWSQSVHMHLRGPSPLSIGAKCNSSAGPCCPPAYKSQNQGTAKKQGDQVHREPTVSLASTSWLFLPGGGLVSRRDILCIHSARSRHAPINHRGGAAPEEWGATGPSISEIHDSGAFGQAC